MDDIKTENNTQKSDAIGISKLFGKLMSKKMLFAKVWGITFILACLWILPQPRFYKAQVMLAPESSEAGALGSIGALASSFGFDLNAGGASDAIYPELYPDLMSSTDFVVSLFDIPVKTLDGEVECSLYEYLKKHQKMTFYMKPFYVYRKKIMDYFDDPRPSAATGSNGQEIINPFMLTKDQTMIVEKLQNNVVCMVDKLTNVFTISVVAQDPLVAATLADSIKGRLQNFIIEYRTNKAHVDLKHYTKLMEKAKVDYDAAVAAYSRFQDSHYDLLSKEVMAQEQKLERDQEVKYNTYNAMNLQVQAAMAKLQERTPAFTILQNASVPVKPAGPKRMIFVAVMLFLATVGTIIHVLKDDVLKTVKFFSRD